MTGDLAARAVACNGWRWMPGMLVVRGEGCDAKNRGRLLLLHQRAGGELRVAWESGPFWAPTPTEWCEYVPDLSDPATLGCLFALVREAWGETAHLVRLQTHETSADGAGLVPACWWAIATGLQSLPLLLIDADGHGHYLAGATEAEALVCALEAAP